MADLAPRNAQPAQVVPYARWLDLLLEKPPGGGLRTVVAKHPDQLDAAEQLVRRRYAWRGYRVAPPERPAGERVTLLAESAGKLLGTLTVGPDSPGGLLAEKTYPGTIEDLRREGRRVGELTRLAVEEGADWRAALDVLVEASWFVARVVHALTDVVIEVNPRHVRFHQRVFGFIVAATGGICTRVGAPSALLLLDLEQFGRRLQLPASLL